MKLPEPSRKTDVDIAELDISVIQYKAKGVSYRCKRLLDYLIAVIGSIMALPLLGIIAIAIKLDSKGPVIFKQERIGLNGKPFIFYKFRSMVNDADTGIHEDYIIDLIQGNVADHSKIYDAPQVFKLNKDERVTKVGRILRRTSLDELPQLFNVIKGDMSLVGPRPPIAYEVNVYKEWHHRRLSVIPGITGLWQVSGRSELDFDDMVRLDIEYMEDWSLLLDLNILLKTFAVVLKRKGAW